MTHVLDPAVLSDFIRRSTAAAEPIRRRLRLFRGGFISQDTAELLRRTCDEVTRFRREGERLAGQLGGHATRLTDAVIAAGTPRPETFDLAEREVVVTDASDSLTVFVALWRDTEAALRATEASLKPLDGP